MPMTFAATEKGEHEVDRLISLDELNKFPIRLDQYDKEHGDKAFVLGIESVLEYAEYLPTVDAVPVTRCKDCRLGETDMFFNGGNDEFWCNYYGNPKPADGFCEKGERRTDEQ